MLKEYRLPNGILYVNTDKQMIENIIDGGRAIEILPGKAYLAGDMRGLPMEEYFACPEIWDAKWEVYQAIKKKGKTVIVIDARGVRKFGDQIMLTVLPKAYEESWGTKAKVDVIIPKGYEEIWAHNPHVNMVATELDKDKEYDKVIDVAGLGLKFRRPEEANCTDAILTGMGLTLINKTPVYVITEEEEKWARKELEKDKKRGLPTKKGLIGISLSSIVKSRTYPHMMEVAKKLRDKDYGLVLLDAKNDDGNFMWTFRQMAALMGLCDLVLTADSALLHLAGALKKRIVGLFAYTEGHIYMECYEKAFPIQAACPYGKKPCWWKIECIPGPNDHLAKTNLDYAHCLKELEPETVMDAVEEQFTKPKNLLLVMLTYDALDMTKKAVESIRSYHNYDFLVVDNESVDGTKEWLKERGIDFVSKRMSAAAAQNVGLKRFLEGNYDYMVLFNNDILLRYDTIDKLVECAEKSGASGVMSTQVPRSLTIDSARPKGDSWGEISKIPAGSYSATLLTRECVERVGLFNERYRPRYIEDNDYTIRMRASGGKFVRAQAALFWHFLGAVVKTVEKGKQQAHGEAWNRNIAIFQEMYGIHPHGPQDLNWLGLEWKRDVDVEKIETLVKEKGRVTIRVERRMGGYGDILFTTVIARELKKKFGNKVEIHYFLPDGFRSLMMNNPNINGTHHFKNSWKADFTIDLTDLEWRVEQQEMLKYGATKSARTEIYLDILGLDKKNLKPDYFITRDEKVWAEEQWDNDGNLKRIVMVMKGSNKLKVWPGMNELFKKLMADKKCAINVLDDKEKHRYSFRQAAALVATADLVVSPDTGISNLAGTLGVPVITIFSNRDGRNFAKMYKSMVVVQGHCPHGKEDYCDWFAPCFGSGPHRPKENIRVPDCLKGLGVGEVYKIVEKELK